mgnify:CR=1 FL=1
MLSCSEVENLLSAYYDGELGVAASQQVEKHLASCKSCMAKLEKMHVITSAVRGIDFPQADDGFQAMLGERLERAAAKMKPSKTARILKFIRPYAAAAACLVLAVGIYTAVDRGYFSQTEQPETQIAVWQPNVGAASENPEIKSNIAPTAEPKTVQTDRAEPKTRSVPTQKPPAAAAEPKTDVSENTQDTDKTTSFADTENDSVMMENVSQPSPEPAEERGTKQQIIKNVTQGYEDIAGVSAHSAGGSGGGGSAEKKFDVTVTFRLDSAEKTAYIEQILAQYGEVSQSGTAIRAKVLAANFDACLATLRAVDGLTETGSAKTEGSGEHGGIVINF